MTHSHKVGYGRPPAHSRFEKGRSGNPRGRPKGTKNLATDLVEELGERIVITESGVRRPVSKQRAMLKSLLARALQGDARSVGVLVNMMLRLLGPTEQAAPPPKLSRDQEAIIARFEARVIERLKRQGA